MDPGKLAKIDAYCDRIETRLDAIAARRADAGFDESKHPRGADGKFGSGGGGGAAPSRAEVVANRAKAAAGGGGGTSGTMVARGGGRLNTAGNAQREAVVAARRSRA